MSFSPHTPPCTTPLPSISFTRPVPPANAFDLDHDFKKKPLYHDSPHNIPITPTKTNRILRSHPIEQSTQTRIDEFSEMIGEPYEVLSFIGSGSFGDVFKIRDTQTNTLYAAKWTKQRHRGHSDRKATMLELFTFAYIHPHPHIIDLHKAWEQDGYVITLTELCEGGDLMSRIQKQRELSENELWTILTDMTLAIKQLHDQQVVHLDIKPENIFCVENGHFKLGDFGLSHITDWTLPSTEGDSRYLATEVLSHAPTNAADIFSLGASLFEASECVEMPTNGPLWHKLRDNPPILAGRSAELTRLVHKMLSHNPKNRPTADELLRHPTIAAELESRKWPQAKMSMILFRRVNAIISLFWRTYYTLALIKPETPPKQFSSQSILHHPLDIASFVVPPIPGLFESKTSQLSSLVTTLAEHEEQEAETRMNSSQRSGPLTPLQTLSWPDESGGLLSTDTPVLSSRNHHADNVNSHHSRTSHSIPMSSPSISALAIATPSPRFDRHQFTQLMSPNLVSNPHSDTPDPIQSHHTTFHTGPSVLIVRNHTEINSKDTSQLISPTLKHKPHTSHSATNNPFSKPSQPESSPLSFTSMLTTTAKLGGRSPTIDMGTSPEMVNTPSFSLFVTRRVISTSSSPAPVGTGFGSASFQTGLARPANRHVPQELIADVPLTSIAPFPPSGSPPAISMTPFRGTGTPTLLHCFSTTPYLHTTPSNAQHPTIQTDIARTDTESGSSKSHFVKALDLQKELSEQRHSPLVGIATESTGSTLLSPTHSFSDTAVISMLAQNSPALPSALTPTLGKRTRRKDVTGLSQSIDGSSIETETNESEWNSVDSKGRDWESGQDGSWEGEGRRDVRRQISIPVFVPIGAVQINRTSIKRDEQAENEKTERENQIQTAMQLPLISNKKQESFHTKHGRLSSRRIIRKSEENSPSKKGIEQSEMWKLREKEMEWDEMNDCPRDAEEIEETLKLISADRKLFRGEGTGMAMRKAGRMDDFPPLSTSISKRPPLLKQKESSGFGGRRSPTVLDSISSSESSDFVTFRYHSTFSLESPSPPLAVRPFQHTAPITKPKPTHPTTFVDEVEELASELESSFVSPFASVGIGDTESVGVNGLQHDISIQHNFGKRISPLSTPPLSTPTHTRSTDIFSSQSHRVGKSVNLALMTLLTRAEYASIFSPLSLLDTINVITCSLSILQSVQLFSRSFNPSSPILDPSEYPLVLSGIDWVGRRIERESTMGQVGRIEEDEKEEEEAEEDEGWKTRWEREVRSGIAGKLAALLLISYFRCSYSGFLTNRRKTKKKTEDRHCDPPTILSTSPPPPIEKKVFANSNEWGDKPKEEKSTPNTPTFPRIFLEPNPDEPRSNVGSRSTTPRLAETPPSNTLSMLMTTPQTNKRRSSDRDWLSETPHRTKVFEVESTKKRLTFTPIKPPQNSPISSVVKQSPTSKVIFIGETGVGKSAFVNMFPQIQPAPLSPPFFTSSPPLTSSLTFEPIKTDRVTTPTFSIPPVLVMKKDGEDEDEWSEDSEVALFDTRHNGEITTPPFILQSLAPPLAIEERECVSPIFDENGEEMQFERWFYERNDLSENEFRSQFGYPSEPLVPLELVHIPVLLTLLVMEWEDGGKKLLPN